MIQVLVYLYQQFHTGLGRYPDHDSLARRLEKAGFDPDDVNTALVWLRDLAELGEQIHPGAIEQGDAVRAFSVSELAKLSPEARGYLIYLDGASILTPALRELAIERAMALEDDRVDAAKLRVIVLMVLWTQHGSVDELLADELLPERQPRVLH